MAHTTANGVKNTDVVAYHEDANGAPAARVDAVLRRAERGVRDLTVRPVPEGDEYKKRAADAELAAFEYIFEYRPYLKREKLSDAELTYVDTESGGLVGLIRGELGPFFSAPEQADAPGAASGSATVRNVSPEPLWGDPW